MTAVWAEPVPAPPVIVSVTPLGNVSVAEPLGVPSAPDVVGPVVGTCHASTGPATESIMMRTAPSAAQRRRPGPMLRTDTRCARWRAGVPNRLVLNVHSSAQNQKIPRWDHSTGREQNCTDAAYRKERRRGRS